MATSPHHIDVYASLPSAEALGDEIDLNPTKWHWVHCLSFPLETLKTLRFSHKPYKWIRYATGVVIGSVGVLSTSSDCLASLDEDAVPPPESATLYYHTTDQEKQAMFPVDPHIERTHITSSMHTAQMKGFRKEITERDGNCCVLSRYDEGSCSAVHLLPHSKGDEYILTFTRRRSRDPTGDNIIDNIDSIQNGLLLNDIAYNWLGKSLAFLMTPNFAMSTTDVDPEAESPSTKRCTSHVFRQSLVGDALSPGSLLRISDKPGFPPDIIFDAVYASAVLRHFGTQALRNHLAATWEDTFHPRG